MLIVAGPTSEFDAAQQSSQASRPSVEERTGCHGCNRIPVHVPLGRNLQFQTAPYRIQEEHRSRKNMAAYKHTIISVISITQTPV